MTNVARNIIMHNVEFYLISLQ